VSDTTGDATTTKARNKIIFTTLSPLHITLVKTFFDNEARYCYFRTRLMREIKRVFDPNNILNAGKIFEQLKRLGLYKQK
jgi:hypothetical protein